MKEYNEIFEGQAVRVIHNNIKGLSATINPLIGLINTNSHKNGSTIRFEYNLYVKPNTVQGEGEILMFVYSLYDDKHAKETYTNLYVCEHEISGTEKQFVDKAVDKVIKTFLMEVMTVGGIVMYQQLLMNKENAG